MAERPIIFSGPMVRALLDGRKTQTRRAIKPQPATAQLLTHSGWSAWHDERGRPLRNPYGRPGGRLWVRETFWAKHDSDSDGYRTIDCGPGLDLGADFHPGVQFVATPENPQAPDEAGEWREAPPRDWDGVADYAGKGEMVWLPWESYSKHPSIHMPRWASRILLEITDVRVERLQGISESDAKAEGSDAVILGGIRGASYREGFAQLWESINGAESWSANPWVWALTFRRIDAPEVGEGE